MTDYRWLKERWLESRWGAAYLNFPLGLLTLAIVAYNDLVVQSRFAPLFPTFETFVVPALVSALLVIQVVGYYHGKIQQATDILKANRVLLEEIRKIVREEIRATMEEELSS